MNENKARILSCLGQFSYDLIENIILDGAYDDLELVGFSESYFSDCQMIEFRFNRGMSNNEFNGFWEEFESVLKDYTKVNFKTESVTYMSHRVYFYLMK